MVFVFLEALKAKAAAKPAVDPRVRILPEPMLVRVSQIPSIWCGQGVHCEAFQQTGVFVFWGGGGAEGEECLAASLPDALSQQED